MGCARESTSKGARSVTAVTVAGQESVIQKYLQPGRRAGRQAPGGVGQAGTRGGSV